MTDVDLGLKPSNVEQTRFDYSPLGKFLNKGLKKGRRRRPFEEEILKRLKNIKDKNEEQLKEIKDKMLIPMMMSFLI